MKKQISVVSVAAMILVVLFVLSGCGNTNNPSQNSSTSGTISNMDSSGTVSPNPFNTAAGANGSNTQSTGSGGQTTLSASGVTSSSNEQGGYLRPTLNGTSDYVLVMAYDASRGESFYKYVDRDSLIRFINSHGADGYFDYHELMYEVGYSVPYDFIFATPFDKNNLAIVTWHHSDWGISTNLMDPQGHFILALGEEITTILPTDEDYLVLYGNSMDSSSFKGVLYNREGKELARIDKIGMSRYEGGKIFAANGVFDAKTLVPVSEEVPAGLQQYSWYDYLGNGYYAVADFSGKDQGYISYWIQFPDLFKKALWKDGVTLTPFEYYYIRQVKPYGSNVFYFADGKESYISNVQTNQRFPQYHLVSAAQDWHHTLYPGLLVGWSADGQHMVLLTDNNISAANWVYNVNGIPTYQKFRNDKANRMYIPQVILADPGITESVNLGIAELMGEHFTAPGEYGDILLSEQTYFALPEIRNNILTFKEEVVGTDAYYDDSFHYYLFHHFDLDTGDHIAFDDWFDDPNAVKEKFLVYINGYFMDKDFTSYGNVTDPEYTYLFDNWSYMFEIADPSNPGFRVYYDNADMGLDSEGTFIVDIPTDVFWEHLYPNYESVFAEQ